MRWVMPDDAVRFDGLRVGFVGLAQSFVDDREHSVLTVVDGGCVAMWRSPDWVAPAPPEHPAEASGAPSPAPTPSPYPPDVQERWRILGEAIEMSHPHDEPHWYLNVLGTHPDRQGEGLGARALGPMCARFDEEGVAAYLESSNPRNMSLYRRHGFVELDNVIALPDGPSLYPMWRSPR
jgi:ribosomal protein S18 acetylase RimI-like enzyme